MEELRFPCATRPSTLRIVLLSLLAEEDQRFGREELKQLGVPDVANAPKVLKFLDVLERSRRPRLNTAFIAERRKAVVEQNPDTVKAFLQKQLQEGCRKAVGEMRVPNDELRSLGHEGLHSDDLNRLVNGLLQPQSGGGNEQMSGNKPSSVPTCLKALHDAVAHCDNLEWLARESDEDVAQVSQKLKVTLEGACPSSWLRDVKDDFKGSAASKSADPAALRPSSGVFEGRQQKRRQADDVLRDTEYPICHSMGPYRVDYIGDYPVYARVWFDSRGNLDGLERPEAEQAKWLGHLAARLRDEADRLRQGGETSNEEASQDRCQ
jgi:hypothetical protein